MFKIGEIVDVIIVWYEILNNILLNIDEICEMIEKCLLECIDKVNEF